MSRQRQLILSLLLIFTVTFFVSAQPVSAQTQSWGSSTTGGASVCTHDGSDTGVATIQGIQCLIGNILQVAVSGIGLAGFVMMIVGSFRYLLSGGNAKNVDDAKKTMTFAVAGLVVALSAFFILNILAQFTGVNSILDFKIPGPSAQPDYISPP